MTDPHDDHRDQTEQLHTPLPTAPAPRISRVSLDEAVTEQVAAAYHENPELPPSKFTAGTTYGAASGPVVPTSTPPSAPQQQLAMPVAPPDAGATPPPPISPPQQHAMLVTSPDTYLISAPPPPLADQAQHAMPVTPPDANSTTGPAHYIPPARPIQRFELTPPQAMWGLTGLAVVAALVSGVGWILVVGGSAYGAWYLGQRRTTWPPDVQELLARVGLAQPPTAPAPAKPALTAYIPFRPMTFTEIYTGAFKVVVRNWPTLVGIPFALILIAGMAGALVFYLMMQVVLSSAGSLYESVGFGSIFVIFGVFGLLMYAVALPLDAILIALGVTTTDRAVRGERIRLTEMFNLARQRMIAVTRLTVGFYTIFIVTDILAYIIFIATLLVASLPLGIFFAFVLLVTNFVLAVMFSLAPIVVVTEQRGAVDSFKRSVHLAKSAFGRILGIHLLWALCATPIVMIPSFAISLILGPLGTILFTLAAFAFLLAYTRTLQVLVYTDLRMRQERYEQELLTDWTRNTGVR